MNNYLYHNTDFLFFLSILETNEIYGATKQTINGKEIKGVSLTRDKHFTYAREITLILDKDKLKQNFKLIPQDYWNSTSQPKFRKGKGNPNRSQKAVESEEFLIGDLKKLNTYLIGFRINDNELYQEIINDKEIIDMIKQYFAKNQKLMILDKHNKKLNLFEGMKLKNILKSIFSF